GLRGGRPDPGLRVLERPDLRVRPCVAEVAPAATRLRTHHREHHRPGHPFARLRPGRADIGGRGERPNHPRLGIALREAALVRRPPSERTTTKMSAAHSSKGQSVPCCRRRLQNREQERPGAGFSGEGAGAIPLPLPGKEEPAAQDDDKVSLGSSSFCTSISKSLALLLPSPNISWMRAFSVVPWPCVISWKR